MSNFNLFIGLFLLLLFSNNYCLAADIEKPLDDIKKHLIRRNSILLIAKNIDDKVFFETNNFYSEEWIKIKFFQVLKDLKFHQIPKLISITTRLIRRYGLKTIWIIKPLKEKLQNFQINISDYQNYDFELNDELKKLKFIENSDSCKENEPLIVPVGYDQGFTAMREKNYNLAITNFQEALTDYENEIERLHNLSPAPDNFNFLIENYKGQITFVIELQASCFFRLEKYNESYEKYTIAYQRYLDNNEPYPNTFNIRTQLILIDYILNNFSKAYKSAKTLYVESLNETILYTIISVRYIMMIDVKIEFFDEIEQLYNKYFDQIVDIPNGDNGLHYLCSGFFNFYYGQAIDSNDDIVNADIYFEKAKENMSLAAESQIGKFYEKEIKQIQDSIAKLQCISFSDKTAEYYFLENKKNFTVIFNYFKPENTNLSEYRLEFNILEKDETKIYTQPLDFQILIEGANSFEWNGVLTSGQTIEVGSYQLQLVMYKNGISVKNGSDKIDRRKSLSAYLFKINEKTSTKFFILRDDIIDQDIELKIVYFLHLPDVPVKNNLFLEITNTTGEIYTVDSLPVNQGENIFFLSGLENMDFFNAPGEFNLNLIFSGAITGNIIEKIQFYLVKIVPYIDIDYKIPLTNWEIEGAVSPKYLISPVTTQLPLI
jgi:hypothetical protein